MICRLCGDMTKSGDYSIGIAQTDEKTDECWKFRFCPKSTISLMVSWSDIPDMRCFPFGGKKNQRDAILKTFGTTEDIIASLTGLPSTTYSLPLFCLLLLKFWTFLLSLLFSIFQVIRSQILTQPLIRHCWKYWVKLWLSRETPIFENILNRQMT